MSKKRQRNTSLHLAEKCNVKDHLWSTGIEPNPGPIYEGKEVPTRGQKRKKQIEGNTEKKCKAQEAEERIKDGRQEKVKRRNTE